MVTNHSVTLQSQSAFDRVLQSANAHVRVGKWIIYFLPAFTLVVMTVFFLSSWQGGTLATREKNTPVLGGNAPLKSLSIDKKLSQNRTFSLAAAYAKFTGQGLLDATLNRVKSKFPLKDGSPVWAESMFGKHQANGGLFQLTDQVVITLPDGGTGLFDKVNGSMESGTMQSELPFTFTGPNYTFSGERIFFDFNNNYMRSEGNIRLVLINP